VSEILLAVLADVLGAAVLALLIAGVRRVLRTAGG
jgi:hypothetical protein